MYLKDLPGFGIVMWPNGTVGFLSKCRVGNFDADFRWANYLDKQMGFYYDEWIDSGWAVRFNHKNCGCAFEKYAVQRYWRLSSEEVEKLEPLIREALKK